MKSLVFFRNPLWAYNAFKWPFVRSMKSSQRFGTILVNSDNKELNTGNKMRPLSNIFVYSKARNGIGTKLHEAVGSIYPKANVETFHSVTRLSERLHRPALNFPIVVLLAMNKEDLENIIAIQDLLLDSRVVLILPDKKEDTMVLGHSLRPRFVSYRDSSFKDVRAVLGKMVNRPETAMA